MAVDPNDITAIPLTPGSIVIAAPTTGRPQSSAYIKENTGGVSAINKLTFGEGTPCIMSTKEMDADSYNIFIGWGGQDINSVDAKNNVALGMLSLHYITSGYNNTAIGVRSGWGFAAVNGVGMKNSVYIGYLAQPTSDTSDNEIVIGANTRSQGSNTAVIGNDSTSATYLKGILHTNSDRIVNIRRFDFSVSPTNNVLATDHHVNYYTGLVSSGGSFSSYLPAGIAGTEYYFYIGGNNGSAIVLIHPNGADKLFYSNCPLQATLGQEIHIVFDATDGWIGPRNMYF